jgi:hypothetical protein
MAGEHRSQLHGQDIALNPQRSNRRDAADTLEIQEVVVRYGFLIDDREWSAFDQVFTDDAVVDYRLSVGGALVGVGPLVGRDEIVRQIRDLQHPIQHMLFSQVIDDVSAD